jgi:hypothetical protein
MAQLTSSSRGEESRDAGTSSPNAFRECPLGTELNGQIAIEIALLQSLVVTEER